MCIYIFCIYINVKLFITKVIRYTIFNMLSTYNFCTIYSYLSHGDLGKWLSVAKEFPGKNIIEQRILAERKLLRQYFININKWKYYYFFQDSGFPM